MQSAYIVIFYLAVFAGVLFLTDAIVGFIRAAGGTNEDAVERRLSNNPGIRWAENEMELLRQRYGVQHWSNLLPFSKAFRRLVMQSGTDADPGRLLLLAGGIFGVTLFGALLFLPAWLSWFAIILAAIVAVAPILVYLLRKRAFRRNTFDEQLPDAIDLIVRSLKIGHPFSGAMQVIAQDMPDPIGKEFAIAAEQVNYGRDIPSAFFEMVDRVGASDLGYMAVAVQIQQESGGNLVESLNKLSAVIRDRFRMFRKARAITAEGRFSAWVLSLFPIAIGGMITLIKPDYYTQAMGFPLFPYLVALVAVMLVINVIAMRMLTNLKV